MQYRSLLMLPVKASANLTVNRFVSPTGGLPSAGGNTLGVANADIASGTIGPVNHQGTAIVEISAAIAKGALIEALSDGRAVTKSSGTGVARALEAGGAAGDRIEVTLIPN